jgi:hypothetical protein
MVLFCALCALLRLFFSCVALLLRPTEEQQGGSNDSVSSAFIWLGGHDRFLHPRIWTGCPIPFLNELERLRPDAELQIKRMMRGAALVLEQAFERGGFRDQ